ncbi:hypothetical protein L596_012390 [Steinernema carpocapsae]|uniref:Uncharacterized protein n=1 Tax=Steinernema carpocapsae TaxID=34508 RepID=A0A4U5NX15_STECR|nr:hypothetical protein L596_012390 [Steinernema carpocapsae]
MNEVPYEFHLEVCRCLRRTEESHWRCCGFHPSSQLTTPTTHDYLNISPNHKLTPPNPPSSPTPPTDHSATLHSPLMTDPTPSSHKFGTIKSKFPKTTDFVYVKRSPVNSC